jgi:hypothetical protein
MKIHKTIELFQPSDLPKKGWIQACFMCETKTAKMFDYKTMEIHTIIYDFKAYLCQTCKNQLKNKKFKVDFFKQCDKQIKADFSQKLFNLNELYLPVDPNPPSPREVSSNSSTIIT